MYEELIEYVKKDDFSPTIFSNILDSYFITCFDNKILDNLLKEQNKTEIKELCYSKLKLGEIFAVLCGIYHQNKPLKYANDMWQSGKLKEVIYRLQELDVAPADSTFDERKYYQFRNLIIEACRCSAFTKNRIIIDFDGTIRFYLDKKDLPEIKRNSNFKNKFELWEYLHAIEKKNWINIFEPEYDDYWVIYPGERLLKIL